MTKANVKKCRADLMVSLTVSVGCFIIFYIFSCKKFGCSDQLIVKVVV